MISLTTVSFPYETYDFLLEKFENELIWWWIYWVSVSLKRLQIDYWSLDKYFYILWNSKWIPRVKIPTTESDNKDRRKKSMKCDPAFFPSFSAHKRVRGFFNIPNFLLNKFHYRIVNPVGMSRYWFVLHVKSIWFPFHELFYHNFERTIFTQEL